jgi:nitrogen fixation/metabolism regulation signal transduction histidine kinase
MAAGNAWRRRLIDWLSAPQRCGGGMELTLLGKHSVPEYISAFEESLQLADRMVRMIVSLRDFAESSAPVGPPQSIALEPIVREVQAEMQTLADAREIRIRLAAEGSTQVIVNPSRMREAIQNILAWIIENSAGGDAIETEISISNGEVHLSLTPPRVDLQYLQIKVLEDIASPGLLFSHAAQNGSMGWAINRRLVDSLGGKLEIVTNGPNAACILARLPSPPAT